VRNGEREWDRKMVREMGQKNGEREWTEKW
jgi:hypothetical protein